MQVRSTAGQRNIGRHLIDTGRRAWQRTHAGGPSCPVALRLPRTSGTDCAAGALTHGSADASRGIAHRCGAGPAADARTRAHVPCAMARSVARHRERQARRQAAQGD
ncbi:hypothetical protein XAR_3350 [Xanthomonas citri pv. glycines str. 8ra]|nr:hypothetical protein XAR_3350 [Xanthomonas citri pv. glycines str. 8ra]